MKSRQVKEALMNAVDPGPESYRTPGALIMAQFPKGHPDKRWFEQGKEFLKTAMIQRDNLALSQSHTGTTGDAGSTCSCRIRKSNSHDGDPRSPNTYDGSPRSIYQPKANRWLAPRLARPFPERNRAAMCTSTAPECSGSKRATGLDDARRTIDAVRASAVGPLAMYPACFIDEIVRYKFPSSFKINTMDKYDGSGP